jgi:hypothetical protein
LKFFNISLFIVCYFALAISWSWANYLLVLDPKNQLGKDIIARLFPIVGLLGLEQNWSLFSPNVRTHNIYNLVVITFENGLLRLFELPRMEKLSIVKKFEQERFRKLFNDNFATLNFTSIRPAFSRFLTRGFYKKSNPPIRISYFLVSEPILPPTSIFNQSQQQQNKYSSSSIENYYVYGISSNDYR